MHLLNNLFLSAKLPKFISTYIAASYVNGAKI